MKKSIIFSALLISLSFKGMAQSQDTVLIPLNSIEEFSTKKDSLIKKDISFKWKRSFGEFGGSGGSHYGKKGTGKCYIYEYGGSRITTRRKGGELVF